MPRRLLLLLTLVPVLLAPAVASADPVPPPAPGSEQSGWDDPATDVAPEPEVPAQDEPPSVLPPTGALPPALPPAAAPATPEVPELPLVTTATVPGRVARLRTDGKAAIPRGAPKAIRAVIAAANQIVGKPYKWGGGHARLVDRGYDCSGAVSYALIRAGLLAAPQVSGTLARWSRPGEGSWLSVYANAGHVYLEVAGLRLDTSAVGDRGGRSGVRWRPVIGKRPRFATRHLPGL